jgi:outer membrane protein OmpA-like peptidoglycan-associated protein
MNNRMYVLFFGLLVVAGCGKRKKDSNCTGINEEQSGYKSGEKKVFDENVDAFMLDDEQNPFGMPNGQRSSMDDASTWNPEDRKGNFEAIYYDYDKATIRPDQQPVLARNVQKIQEAVAQGDTVVLEGHACKFGGSVPHNVALSVERSESVKDYLVDQGIAEDKLKVVGRGNEMPKVVSGNKEQQAPNRRVEIYAVAAQ